MLVNSFGARVSKQQPNPLRYTLNGAVRPANTTSEGAGVSQRSVGLFHQDLPGMKGPTWDERPNLRSYLG